MHKYVQYVVFRIFLMVVMPLVFVHMLIFYELELQDFMFVHAVTLIGLGLMLVGVIADRFRGFFDTEIYDDDDVHPLYKQKTHEIIITAARIADLNRELTKSVFEVSEREEMAQSAVQKAEFDLSLTKERLRIVENNITELLGLSQGSHMIIDYSGQIYQLNKQYREYLGYDPVDMNITELFVHDENYDNRLLERLTDKEKSFSGVLNHIRLGEASLAKITSSRLGGGMYLVTCEPVGGRILEKSAALVQNREIEYINRITLSLAIGGGTDEMLANVAGTVVRLFDIEDLVMLSEENGVWNRGCTMGGRYSDALPIDAVREYISRRAKHDRRADFGAGMGGSVAGSRRAADAGIGVGMGVGVVGAGAESGFSERREYVLKLYDSDFKRIYMVFSSENIDIDEINILKIFEIQIGIAIQRSIDLEKLRTLFFRTAFSLVDLIEANDKYTEGHSYRVSHYAVELGKKLGYGKDDIDKLKIAGVLHDLGKISISRNILQKAGNLSDEEFDAVKRHPMDGYRIIENIDFDERIKQAVAYHHVRYDLKGYPEDHGLTELPEFAAIISIVDAFDAMTTKRVYSDELTTAEALQELAQCSGKQFAPYLVDAMIELCTERDLIQEIYERRRIDD